MAVGCRGGARNPAAGRDLEAVDPIAGGVATDAARPAPRGGRAARRGARTIDGALAVLSPDGQTLVYAGTRDSVRRLYVRPLDSLESRPLSGTEDARSPFFSPDGRWIAFFSGGMLKKVEVTGGAPVSIASAPESRGGTWGPDDTIVFTPTTTTGLYRVAAAGGTPVEMTKPLEKERTHRWPSFLPDGNAVVFVRQDQNAAYDDGFIEAVRLDTNERKILIRGGTFPRYLASGHLVYVRENTLFAVPFDAEAPRGPGESAAGPVRRVVQRRRRGHRQWHWVEPDRVLLQRHASSISLVRRRAHTLAWSSSIGRASGSFTYPENREFRDPRFSPDGARVALQMGDGKTSHVYVLDVDRAAMTKVTFDGSYNALPVWSPDGSAARVLFGSRNRRSQHLSQAQRRRRRRRKRSRPAMGSSFRPRSRRMAACSPGCSAARRRWTSWCCRSRTSS